jgi:hypothetical protein
MRRTRDCRLGRRDNKFFAVSRQRVETTRESDDMRPSGAAKEQQKSSKRSSKEQQKIQPGNSQ